MIPQLFEETIHCGSILFYIPCIVTMKYGNEIYRVVTKECYFPEPDWEDPFYLIDFLWDEGNWSCDCNRKRVLGLTSEQTECGNSIIAKMEFAGRVIFDEFEDK